MSLDESSRKLLTDIAENIPKVKQQGYDEGYDKGRTDENADISTAFRDTTFARNLFDKDNIEIFHNWNSGNITATDTGLRWTNLGYSNGAGGYLVLKLGLAKDYAGKTLTLSTKQFYSKYTIFMLCNADRTTLKEGSALYTSAQQRNGTYINRLRIDEGEYTDEVITIRLYFAKEYENIVFDEIMVHDHYDALQPYVPYGYVPDVGTVEDYSREVSDLYEKGLNDCIKSVMEIVQGYGARTNYEYAFYSNIDYGPWNPTTFYPQYDIRGTSFNRAFYGFARYLNSTTVLDLSKRLEECGVVLDTSEATTLASCFNNARITRIPTLDCRNCKDSDGLSSAFSWDTPLVTVDKMIVKRTQKFTNTFNNAQSLANIIFDGEIGQDISFLQSPLTLESVKNIIEHLADYSTENTGTYTLTLKDECKTALESDFDMVEFNGGIYTYLGLITAKGWNLA